MIAPLREHLQELNTGGKNIATVINQDRLIIDNLKRQIKNRTLYTCRLFLKFSIYQQLVKSILVFAHPLSSIYLATTIFIIF